MLVVKSKKGRVEGLCCFESCCLQFGETATEHSFLITYGLAM